MIVGNMDPGQRPAKAGFMASRVSSKTGCPVARAIHLTVYMVGGDSDRADWRNCICLQIYSRIVGISD